MKISEFTKQLNEFRGESPADEDLRLENDCIHLLSRMEHHTGQFTGARTTKHMLFVLNSCRELIVEVIEFVNGRLGNDSLTAELPRITSVRERTENLLEAVSRPAWATVLGRKSMTSIQKTTAYENLGKDYAELFKRCLAPIGTQFHNDEKLNEWQGSCQVFIDDLIRNW